jgi:hypothetical protein
MVSLNRESDEHSLAAVCERLLFGPELVLKLNGAFFPLIVPDTNSVPRNA